MKKFISAILMAASISVPAMAVESEELVSYRSWDSMGCMILRECTDEVKPVASIADVEEDYPDVDYSVVQTEFNQLMEGLDEANVDVFLAPSKYFLPMNRGVYDTKTNTFFLNRDFMDRPETLLSVTRHEGWHAAQDCMAGTINNTYMAVIMNEEEIPVFWRELTKDTYASRPESIPWEQEAMWAGRTEGMTVNALSACATGAMWEIYEPTPLTRQYLVDEGYIKE